MGLFEVIILLYWGSKIVLQSHRNNQVAHNRDGLGLISWCLVSLRRKILAFKWLLLHFCLIRRVYTIFQVLFDATTRNQEWIGRQIYRLPIGIMPQLCKLLCNHWFIEPGCSLIRVMTWVVTIVAVSRNVLHGLDHRRKLNFLTASLSAKPSDILFLFLQLRLQCIMWQV